MTRTVVCAGEPPEEVRQPERLVREALEQVRAKAAPGVSGAELHGLCCDLFEGGGYRTQRIGPGDDRFVGFQFALGHGVGLEIHENPVLSMTADSTLDPRAWGRDRHRAGTVGPSRGRRALRGLLLITESGCQTLTAYRYELAP